MTSTHSKTQADQTKEWLSILAGINELLLAYSPDAVKERRLGEKRRLGRPALSALFEAYADTLGYYVRMNSSGRRAAGEEAHIARLWQKLGTQIAKFDEDLGRRLKAKNVLWSGEAIWSKQLIQKAWPLLNEIRTNANLANQDDPDTRRLIGWKTILAAA